MDKEFITITNPDGTIKEAEVLLYFTLKENNKDYIIYTFNEKDDKDMLIIYTSSVINNENYSLEDLNDEEWTKIKDIMRLVIKENRGE